MKSLTFFAVFLLFVDLSLQISELRNCSSDIKPSRETCTVITCHGENSFSQLGCALSFCLPEKHLGYIEVDNSKVYPECCGRPICAD